MDKEIYDKIILLEINKHKTSDIPTTTKREFENSSMQLSGNFIIVCTHDIIDKTKMICTPFNISDVKSYKIN